MNSSIFLEVPVVFLPGDVHVEAEVGHHLALHDDGVLHGLRQVLGSVDNDGEALDLHLPSRSVLSADTFSSTLVPGHRQSVWGRWGR